MNEKNIQLTAMLFGILSYLYVTKAYSAGRRDERKYMTEDVTYKTPDGKKWRILASEAY